MKGMDGPKNSQTASDMPTEQPNAIASARLGQEWSGGAYLESVLGIGGTAAVYRSTMIDGTAAAVKVMHASLLGDAELRASFELEATLLIRLDEPSLPMCIASGHLPTGEPFLAMELLEGALVSDILAARGGQLAPEDAVYVMSGVLSALSTLHDAGVVHRDIKPANLFVQTDGRIKLLDLGAALLLNDSSVTPAERLIGSPSYMAPEQAVNATLGVDARSDVFATGATLFHLLTGVPIRSAPSVDELFGVAATTPAPSLAQVAPGLPGALVPVVDRALSWVPADRFGNAAEFLQALEENAELGDLPASALARAGSHALRSALGLSDSDDEESVELDDKGRMQAQLREFFRRCSRAILALRRYKPDSEEFASRYQPVRETLDSIFTDLSGGIPLVIRPYAFEWSELPVWEPEVGLEDVPYFMFQSGFRGILLHREVEDAELVRLLKLMSLDPIKDLAFEDDLSTVFFEGAFESIEANIISGFDVDILDHYESFGKQVEQINAELERESASSNDDGLGQLAAILGKQGVSEADAIQMNFSTAGESVNAIAWRQNEVDFARVIPHMLQHDLPRWIERVARMLAAALVQAERDNENEIVYQRIGERIQQLSLGASIADALPMLGGIVQYAPRRLSEALLSFILNDELGEKLLVAATLPRPQWENRVFALDRQFVKLLRVLPAALNDSLITLWYRHEDSSFAGVFGNEVVRRTISDPTVVAGRITEAPESIALSILRTLIEQPSDGTLAVFRAALDHHIAAVQVTALSLLLAVDPQDTETYLKGLLESGDPRARRTAIRLIAENHAKGMVGMLTTLTRADRFHELPLAERQALIVTLHGLSPQPTREVLEFLIRPGSLTSSRNTSPTRTLAADLMATLFPDRRTIEVLRKETTRLLRTPGEVKKFFIALLARLESTPRSEAP
jgi:serine/threonine protein kinase